MKIKFTLITFTLSMLMMGSCDQIANDNLQDGQAGSVVVKITDAPFPAEFVDEANVKVDRIELKKKDDENNDKEDDDSGSVVLIMDEPQTFNLLELSNGVTKVMADLEIPTGEYNEIRLHIVDADIVLTDGKEFDLKIPSGSSSGLKIKISPSLFIFKDKVSEVLLDFDVSRSFKPIGNIKAKKDIKGFHFKPVIRAVNLTEAGEISGVVTNSDNEKIINAGITLFSGSDTITTAITSDKGYYAIIGLPAGVYEMECEKEGYPTKRIENVTVVVKEVTEKNFILSK